MRSRPRSAPTGPNSGVRLVLDTNTAVSGLLWLGGPPARLIDVAEAGRIEVFSSTALLAELHDVLTRPKFAGQLAKRGLNAIEVFDGYAALVSQVVSTVTPRVIERDPDDDHVLACALAARASLIVSGDRHLLDLDAYRGIPIVTAGQAIALMEQESN